MTDVSNVLAVAEAKPDFMGFIFYKGSPRCVNRDAKELLRNVPTGIKKIGVFMNEERGKLLEISAVNGLDMIQLHGSETPEFCFALNKSGLRIIKTFNIGDDFRFRTLEGYLDVCDYFLFDTRSKLPGGSGLKFNWEKLDQYNFDKPFFLSGGISPGDEGPIGALTHRLLYAVDINSRFEASPGIKNPVAVNAFIRKLYSISNEV